MKIYYHLLINQRVRSGFTLIELMMASILTLVVVGVAGYGAVVMLRENTASSMASDTQYNLNRAADFIIEEIRSSGSVTADSSLATILSTIGTGACDTTGATPVLGLAVNGSATTNVVYYRKAPDSTWLGTNAIYRCGPSLNSDGSYGSTASYMLVDLIASSRDSKDSGTCGNGGSAYPNDTSGFFVCKSGMLAEIHLASSALNTQTNTAQWISSSSTSRLNDRATYGVVTQGYARAPGGNNLSVAPSSVAKGSATPLVYTFTRYGSTTSAATVNFSVAGTARFTTDYTQSGATFTMASNTTTGTGTITIPAGSSTALLRITPVPTTTLPANPSGVIIVLGSNQVTGNITN